MAEFIQTRDGRNRMTLDLNGSRITDLVLEDRRIGGKVFRNDGPATSHSCIPNHDEVNPKYGLKRHGPMRNTTAGVIRKSGNSLTTRALLSYGEDLQLDVTQIFNISPGYVEIITVNKNACPFPVRVNSSVHQYFDAPRGLSGALLNDEPVEENARNDRAFTWNKENTLLIPKQPGLLIVAENLPVVNTWTGEKAGSPFDKYLSVSGVEGFFRPEDGGNRFESTAAIIQRGQSRETRYIIARTS